jgi:3-oxoacyl-[acyl-carrier-protein] synthase-3
MIPAYLAGFGHYVPPRVVTNAELAESLGRTVDWIESSSGIRERRYADGESVADMGATAARNCLARTETPVSDVGMLIVSSGSAARGFPGPAAEIAHKLDLGSTPALDVPIASAGSLFALALAMRLTPAHGRILVVATEKMSELAGNDPNIAMLFGDGAGAALVSTEPGQWRLTDAVLHSDGQYRDDLKFDGTLQMNGRSVILHAARKMPSVIEELLARHNMRASEVTAFLLHQANSNLLTRVARALNVDPGTVFSNIIRYGNTSSASLLIAASEWEHLHPPAGPVIFSAFGAGFHWGAVLAMPE